jgi:hypothetical protein
MKKAAMFLRNIGCVSAVATREDCLQACAAVFRHWPQAESGPVRREDGASQLTKAYMSKCHTRNRMQTPKFKFVKMSWRPSFSFCDYDRR